MKIEEKIPQHLIKLAQKLDKQIEVLEHNGDLGSVFDSGHLRELKTLGKEDYLACLKRTRLSLGQPEDLSGD